MSSVAVRRFKDSDLRQIVSLKNSHSPGSGDRWERRFNWQFKKNPAYTEGEPFGWVLVSNDEVCGAAFVMPQKFRSCETTQTIPILTDLIVSKNVSIHCLRLLKAYFDHVGDRTCLCTSAAETPAKLWKVFHGRHISATDTERSFVLNAGKVLSEKLRLRFGLSLPRFITAAVNLAYTTLHRRALSAGKSLRCEFVSASDSRVQNVTAESIMEFGFTSERSVDYLKWRFEETGAKLLLISTNTGHPVCWVAYTEVPADNNVKRARLLDILGNACLETMRQSVSALLIHLQSEDFVSLVVRATHISWQHVFTDLGFRSHLIPSSFTIRTAEAIGGASESIHIVPADGDCGFWDLSLGFPEAAVVI